MNMKTKTIEVCNAISVDVTCEMNDMADIKCGGPATIGYNFYVSPDENKKDLEEFLRKCIREYHRPLMGITFDKHKDFPVKHLWTREKMEKCIKENGLGL